MAFIAIASQTLASNASSVVFSSIPSSFRDLIIVCNYTSSAAGAIQLGMNAGVTARTVWARGSGSATSSGYQQVTPLEFGGNTFSSSTDRAQLTIQIFDYAQTDKNKTILTRMDVATGSFPGTVMIASQFLSTAAITSLTLNFGGGQTFQAGSVLSLYGVQA